MAAQMLDLMIEFQAQGDASDDFEDSTLPIWLVLASEHEDEFAGVDLSQTYAGPHARLFGRIVEELALMGAHSNVCRSCAAASNGAFNAMLRRALETTVKMPTWGGGFVA